MKMNDESWRRLVAAARRAPGATDEQPPLGFSARVAARAMEMPRVGWWNFGEGLAFRGLLAACALGVGAVIFHFAATNPDRDDDVASGDSMGEILDLAS